MVPLSASTAKSDLKSADPNRSWGVQVPLRAPSSNQAMSFNLFDLMNIEVLCFCGSWAYPSKSGNKFRYSPHPLYFQCGTTYPFLQRTRPYAKFISFTLDYGMRFGLLVRTNL